MQFSLHISRDNSQCNNDHEKSIRKTDKFKVIFTATLTGD